MNAIRSAISAILVLLVALAVAGWLWADGQPTHKAMGARLALGLSAGAALFGLLRLWQQQGTPASSERRVEQRDGG